MCAIYVHIVCNTKDSLCSPSGTSEMVNELNRPQNGENAALSEVSFNSENYKKI